MKGAFLSDVRRDLSFCEGCLSFQLGQLTLHGRRLLRHFVELIGTGKSGISKLQRQEHIRPESEDARRDESGYRNPFTTHSALILVPLLYLFSLKLVYDGVKAGADSSLIGLGYIAVATFVTCLAFFLLFYYALDLPAFNSF